LYQDGGVEFAGYVAPGRWRSLWNGGELRWAGRVVGWPVFNALRIVRETMGGKVALVTGASSGIGTAVVAGLADAGYSILAAGRDRLRTEHVGTEYPEVRTWVGDITTPESCADLVMACIEQFGRLDVLVNNAGIYQAADAERTTNELWSRTLAVNLNAPFYLSRDAMPHLRQTKGVILNIASDWGLVGGKKATAYCASKGGMVLMTKSMALDHAHEGIRINAICPGDVETPMLYAEGAARGLEPDQALREAARASPTGKVTSAADVAALVVFLASEAASQITGAALSIDGGNTA
jgi:NAD(P)-dependent dehydrogenase (short-subunit alcohol dehydrogenase family)